MTRNKGFTLIELLVVIGIIGILAAVVIAAVNPGRQFAEARNTQRRADLYQLTNGIYQFAAEHNGNLPGTDDTVLIPNFPPAATCIGTLTGAPDNCFNLGAAGDVDGQSDGVTEPIVPTYMAAVPYDPSVGSLGNASYTVFLDATTGRITAAAPGAELNAVISVTR